MVDRNTRTDYAKLDKLVKLDQLDGDRKGILLEVAENGYTLGTVADSFPAAQLTDPKMFKSLLFYYGMVTITGTYGIEQELSIPNNNVRKQYYDFLLREYQQVHAIDFSPLVRSYTDAAFKGRAKPNRGRTEPARLHERLPQPKPVLPHRPRSGTEPRLLRLLPHARPDPLAHGKAQLHLRTEIPAPNGYRRKSRSPMGGSRRANQGIRTRRKGKVAHTRNNPASHSGAD